MQTATIKYPEIIIPIDLSGPSGNAFVILGRVNHALHDAGVPKEERDEFFAEATSGDYDHLLKTVRSWVTAGSMVLVPWPSEHDGTDEDD